MTDRVFTTLAFVAMLAAGAARAAPPSLPSGQDGSSVRADVADPAASDPANLPQSAPNAGEAPIAYYDAAGPGQPLPGQIAPGNPRDVAEFKAPAQVPADPREAPNLRPFDGIPRLPIQKLPAFSVRGAHVFVFRPRDLYSNAGMIDQSFRRHPGLYVGNQFKLNDEAAHEMFLEDDWRSTKSDYWSMAQAMAMGGDRNEGRMILDEVDAADLKVRDDVDSDGDQPSTSQFRLGQLGGDSRLLEVPAIPFDFTVVRVKW